MTKSKSAMAQTPPLIHRNAKQIQGNLSRLTVAINNCLDGAQVTIELKLAINLSEICRQAIQVEKGHEQC